MDLPTFVPQRDYVPHGYLDNPYHSAVLNRSGVIRSVPPAGFGFWCRRMPWAYGDGTRRNVNYLSFLHPSIEIDGAVFHDEADFARQGARLVSRCHTKNLMTYDWRFRDVEVRLGYFMIGEHTLACQAEFRNTGSEQRSVKLHATHIYGFPETKWWGLDGFSSRAAGPGACVAKIWAYGDVFMLRFDEATSYRATHSRSEWNGWITRRESAAAEPEHTIPPVYSVLGGSAALAPRQTWTPLITLTRDVSEVSANRRALEARDGAGDVLGSKLKDDAAFYADAPMLEGDWPEDWKSGWIYDIETLRMCARPPIGIYKHRWDGMQIFSPRSVLAESLIDAMALSYFDMALAKELILGVFADAPMPNVPCSREDGSMNMVGMGGEECGTAPIWVLPFRTICSVFARDRDEKWLAELFPHLEAFVQWWLDNRRDAHGRFFCNNSWESGQDGSKRFLLGDGEEGKEAEYVQTADVEAAMADAMWSLAYLALFAGARDRSDHWLKLGNEVVKTTRAMFVDGWFRDFDARTGTPILIPDYLDVMMLVPVALDVAGPDQAKAIRPKIDHFLVHQKHWLEWPSFLFVFTEAGRRTGARQEMADLVAAVADRVYKRTNGCVHPIGQHEANIPDPYNYRIPGTANEYWPLEPGQLPQCGSEAYGWGATLPTLILRNIAGFLEGPAGKNGARIPWQWDGPGIEPTLPRTLKVAGKRYRITNLRIGGRKFTLEIGVRADGTTFAQQLSDNS